MNEFSGDRNPVEELAEDFLERKRRGERPTLAAYVDRHPELAEEIRELFPALLTLEDLKPQAEDLTFDHERSSGTSSRDLPSQIGEYRILGEIGRGGMGVVYEAEQVSLGRRVALKLLPSEMAHDEKAIRRFRREARAAAQLHHTNIVPVFEVGQDGDKYFYVMQFIQGQPLDQVISELHRLRKNGSADAEGNNAKVSDAVRSLWREPVKPSDLVSFPTPPEESVVFEENRANSESSRSRDLPKDREQSGISSSKFDSETDLSSERANTRNYFRSIARIGLQVASAMSYSHSRGVLHRDIKPSNLLLGVDGVVWVADFGSAKMDEDNLTRTGDLVGTVRYMGPERFRGQCDARSDVYALGVTLYELLTLRPAFEASDRLHLIDAIAKESPVPPRSLDARIPRDLETIAMKAMDREQNRRYQTAEELRDDLRRFLDDEPVRARRISFSERLIRWSKHNKALAASLAGCLLFLAVATVSIAIAYMQSIQIATSAGEDAKQATQLAEERKQSLEDTRHALYATTVRMLSNQPDTESHRWDLEQFRPKPGEQDFRDLEWYHLRSPSPVPFSTIRGHATNVNHIAVNPNSDLLASNGADMFVRIWNMKSGKQVHKLLGEPSGWSAVDFSPDGTRLAVSYLNGLVKIFEIASESELMSFWFHANSDNSRFVLYAVAWSPDGRHLAAGGSDGKTWLWSAETGKHLHVLNKPESAAALLHIAWNKAGTNLATGYDDGSVCIWDSTNISIPLRTWNTQQGSVFSLSWHPDGDILATSGNTAVQTWNSQSAQLLRSYSGHTKNVTSAIWSPDGKWLASSSGDKTLRVWNSTTGQERMILPGRLNGWHDICWSGRKLIAADVNGSFTVWDMSLLGDVSLANVSPADVKQVAWNLDGTRVALIRGNGMLEVSDVPRREAVTSLPLISNEVSSISLNPSGNILALILATGEVQWLDANTLAPTSSPIGAIELKDVARIEWSSTGNEVVTAQRDGAISAVELSTGKRLWRIPNVSSGINALALHPGGRWLAAAEKDLVRVWDTASQQQIHTISIQVNWLNSMAWSPSGRRLAIAGGVATTVIERTQTPGGDFNGAVIANPSAAAIRIWDIDQPQGTMDLHGHSRMIWSVCWNPTGTRIASAGADQNCIVWDVTPVKTVNFARNLLNMHVHSTEVRSVRWSTDGMVINSVGLNGVVRSLDTTSGHGLDRTAELLTALNNKVSSGTASTDERLNRAECLARVGSMDEARADLDWLYSQEKVDSRSWFVMPWWVIGPYPADLSFSFPPEQHVDPFSAVPLSDSTQTTHKSLRHWVPYNSHDVSLINFVRVLQDSQDSTNYALTHVYSVRNQNVGLLLSCTGSMRVWLNNQQVYESTRPQRVLSEEHFASVTLNQGWNVILVKVVNYGGDNLLTARISTDPVECAMACENGENWNTALAYWDHAVEAQPEQFQFLLRRAGVNTRLERRDKSKTDIDRASGILSAKGSSAVFLSRAYENAALWELALEELSRGLTSEPENIVLLVNRGELLGRMGRWHAANKDFTEAVRLAPDHHYLWNKSTILLLGTGELTAYHARCREMLSRINTLQPTPASRTIQASVLSPHPNEDLSALAELARSMLINRLNPNANWTHRHAMRGLAEIRSGQFQEALRWLEWSVPEQAESFSPIMGRYKALLNLSMAYSKLHRVDDARRVLQLAREKLKGWHASIVKNGVYPRDVWIDWVVCEILRKEAEKLLDEEASYVPSTNAASSKNL